MGKWQVLILAAWENLVLLKLFPLHAMKDGLLFRTLAKVDIQTYSSKWEKFAPQFI